MSDTSDAFESEQKPSDETPVSIDELLEGDDEQSVEESEAALKAALIKQEEEVLYLRAEVENMRRRMEKRVTDAHKFALEKFLNELLPVLDSLDQALLAAAGAEDTQKEGLQLMERMFIDVLKKFNVTLLGAVGETFDPQKHEAMTMQPSEEHPAGTILTVFQRGCVLNGRLVRPARVVVSEKTA